MENKQGLTRIQAQEWRISKIPQEAINDELELLVNVCYSVIAINDESKLTTEELPVFKTLVATRLKRYTVAQLKNAFIWAVMNEDLFKDKVYRLDIKTLSKAVKTHQEYLRVQRMRNPIKEAPKMISVDYSPQINKAILDCYQDFKVGELSPLADKVVFDRLIDKGLIEIDSKTATRVKGLANRTYRPEVDKRQSTHDIIKQIKFLKETRSSRIKNRCKMIYVNELFNMIWFIDKFLNVTEN